MVVVRLWGRRQRMGPVRIQKKVRESLTGDGEDGTSLVGEGRGWYLSEHGMKASERTSHTGEGQGRER